MTMKKTLMLLLCSFSGTLLACGPYYPPSFIDEEEAEILGVQEKELVYHLTLLSEHFMPDVVPPSPRSTEKDPPPPRLEYQLYEEGVKEITADPKVCFPKAWKKLLQLPPSERRYRTVRTLYMLGNLALRNKEDDRSAWKFYHALRKAVRDEGFPDNLALSRDTFNALRRYSASLGQLRYLPLAARFNASKVSYRTELKEIVQRLTVIERCNAFQDPYLAELLLLADPRNVKTSPHKFLLADRLAMRAYQKGNLLLCADLLKQAPDDSLIKLFLQARFARFSGDTKRTSELLHRWLKLSQDALAAAPQYEFLRDRAAAEGSDYGSDPWTFDWRREVHGQLGLISLEEKDYQEALLAFMKAGSWADAALIAEQYLSTEALQKVVDANFTGESRIEVNLRYLLARSLLRQGKIKESIPYFPRYYQGVMEAYLTQGENFHSLTSAEERAKALFKVGQIQMKHNIELFGYEFAPDFYICQGCFDHHNPWKMQKTTPLPRFHYRWIIADTFRQVADLTQNRDLQFISLLAAGWTLKYDSPAAVDPYYKRLCNMKLSPLSEILVRSKWLPPRQGKWRERFCEIEPEPESLQKYLKELSTWWQQSLTSEMWKDVRIVVKRKNPSDHDLVEIWQNGQKVFSLQTHGSADVVRFEKRETGNSRRGYSEFLQNGEDFKKYLVDLRGDGDKRHLIIVDWYGGNSAYGFKGYLLDTKNHFAYLGEVPAGEACDYPCYNYDLVFTFEEEIAYFGCFGSAVLTVPMRLKDGKNIPVAEKNENFELNLYLNMLKSNEPPIEEERRRMTFIKLYADLSSHGLLKKGTEFAKHLGFKEEEIEKYQSEAEALIRASKFWQHLAKINE